MVVPMARWIEQDGVAVAARNAAEWFTDVARDSVAPSDVERHAEGIQALVEAYEGLLAQTKADGEKLRNQELLLTRAGVDERRYQQAQRQLSSELEAAKAKAYGLARDLEAEREVPDRLAGTELGKMLRKCKEHVRDLHDGNVDEVEAESDFNALLSWVRRTTANANRTIPGDVDAEIPDHIRDEMAHMARKLYANLKHQAILVASVRVGEQV